MSDDTLHSLSALAGAPDGVAELLFNAFPSGTQLWLLTYGLAVKGAGGQLMVSETGRQAIAHAAERAPAPYADLAVGDILVSTYQAFGKEAEIPPTEDQPGTGFAFALVGTEQIPLLAACWWRDDSGDYVMRSQELYVIAGGRSFEEALDHFACRVIDFAVYLTELEARAENEEEMFRSLSPRLAEITNAELAELQPSWQPSLSPL